MKLQTNRFLYTALLALMGCLLVLSVSANPDEDTAADDALAPSWLEPRPLSVVDLISGGIDPSLMAGSPLVWQPGQALLQYTSGSKSGNTVIVNAKMLPVQTSNAFCLGQDGIRDQWPIVVPESHVRITSNGSDITGQIDWVQYFPAGQEKPNRGSSDGPARYPEHTMHGSELNYDSQGRIIIPANMGCKIYFKNGAGDGGNINLEFEHTLTHYISVSVVSSFENTFKSY